MAIATPVTLGERVLTNQTAQTLTLTTVTNAVIVDDTIICWFGDDGSGGTWTVADSVGNTYTPCHLQLNLTDNYNLRAFYSVATADAPIGTVITGTRTGGVGGTWDLWAMAERVRTKLIQDGNQQTAASGTGWFGGGVVPSVPEVLIVGGACAGGAPTGTDATSIPAANYTEMHDEQGGSFIDITSVYRITSSIATYDAGGTWTVTDNWAADTIAFRDDGPPSAIMHQYMPAMNAMRPSNKGYR